MIIAAISDLDVLGSDIHDFFELLKKTKEPDLLLFAGDMYEYEYPEQYADIVDRIKWKCPIVAVFGNREFPEDIEQIKKSSKGRIIFLEEEAEIFRIKGKTVGIVGSRGCLDYPTYWQRANIIAIEGMYKEKYEKIKQLLSGLKVDVKILLTHYAPTYRTLTGENTMIYSGLGCKKLEKLITSTKTNLAIHGHAHYGRHMAFVGKTPVYNVSFPITGKFTIIDTDKLPKKGVAKFV